MNKKAISPLISTMVLIVFAGALGMVVISWGNEAVQPIAMESECDRVSLSLVNINNIPQICYSNSEIEFTAENNGEANIIGLKIIVISKEGISKSEIDDEILIGDVIREKVEFINASNIQKVVLTPKISQNKKEKICAKKSVDIENIVVC